MFYAWRLVKWELVLNTNKLCVGSEKTSVKVVFCELISECFFYPGHKTPPPSPPRIWAPPGYKPPQNPLQSCISPGLISRILRYFELVNDSSLTGFEINGCPVVRLSWTTKNMLGQPNSVQWLPLGQPMASRKWCDLALRDDATLNAMKLRTYRTFRIAAYFFSLNTVILWTKPFKGRKFAAMTCYV